MNDPLTRFPLSVLKIIKRASEETQESHMLSKDTIKLLLFSVAHMLREDTTKLLLLPVASEKYTFVSYDQHKIFPIVVSLRKMFVVFHVTVDYDEHDVCCISCNC